MRAVLCERQGPPDEMKLVDLPDPVAGPGEAVVRLHACGLNHRDVWIRQGLYARIQLPCVLGRRLDHAGSVGPEPAGELDARVEALADPDVAVGPPARGQRHDGFARTRHGAGQVDEL